MNKIDLRTNKGEYRPGEEICGAVYLKISRPTAGRGVQLKVCGYERFSYPAKPDNFQLDPSRQSFCDEKTYILTPWVKLHETKGTFYGEGTLDNTPWEARVEYSLEAQVIDANELKVDKPIFVRPCILETLQPPEFNLVYKLTKFLLFTETIIISARNDAKDFCSHCVSWGFESEALSILKASHCIVIYQDLPEGMHERDLPQAFDKTYPIRFLYFFERYIDVTVRLLQNVHRAGETLYLRVIVTNNSSTVVTSLHLQLLRQIKLISKQGSEYRVQCIEDWVPVGKRQDLDMSNCPKGFDKLHIPLRNSDNSSIFPSVDGFLVKCNYKLDIRVRLSNNAVISNFEVPVPVIISEKNREWLEWTVPDWVSYESLDIIEGGSSFSVPRNVLQTEPFSTVPGMQRL